MFVNNSQLIDFLRCEIQGGYILLPLERIFEPKYDIYITSILPKIKTVNLGNYHEFMQTSGYITKYTVGGKKSIKTKKTRKTRKSRKIKK